MAQYQKSETSTATQNAIPIVSSCDGCPKVNTSSSSTPGFSSSDMLFSTIGQLHDLQQEVQKLQNASRKTLSFYDSTSKLNNTVRTVVIILMLIPIAQLLLCVAVVYSLGIQDELPGLLSWALSGVGIASIIELSVGGAKLFHFDKRIEAIEKRIDSLSNVNGNNQTP